MPDRSDLDRRYAAAQADERAAEAARDRAVARDSAVLLRKLQRQSVEQRFQALEQADLQLTAAHRRDLVRSIRGTAAERPVVSAGTATRWEVWRSRLRFRLFAAGATAVTATTAVILIAVANHRTPVQWVKVDSPQTFEVQRTYPGGEVIPYPIHPGSRYAAVQFSGDQVLLREWEPGSGYATFWVPRSMLTTDP